MKYIYVAGPYTNPDPVENTRKAILAGDELIELGYSPYIPHLTLFWHFLSPHDIGYWYMLDIEWLVKCDAVLRLPGESVGADKEVQVAQERGIPVFYSIDELIRCAAKYYKDVLLNEP